MELIRTLLISLPMMVCAFWLTFFIIRCLKPNDELPTLICLLLFYAASTVLYTNHWLYYSGAASFVGEWSYTIVNLSVYPLFYAYLHAVTHTRFSVELGWLLLPAALIAVLSPLNNFFGWGQSEALISATRICFGIQVLWVWIRGYKLIQSTIRRLDNIYTDDRSRFLRPIHILLQILSITSAVSVTLNIIGREFFTNGLHIALPALLMTILLYGVGYTAAHTSLPQETVGEDTLNGTGQHISQEQLVRELDEWMQASETYLKPTLTIADVANELGTNRTYLSAAINSVYGINFSTYVNRFRVERAKHILTDPGYDKDKQAIMDAIALSGFAGEQTFYRVFKELTGVTPMQYRHTQN